VNFQTAYPTHKFGNRKKNLTRKNAFYGQAFCANVTKRFRVFQKHLVFVLNVKIKDRMRPKEFSFARREERPLRPSFLHSRDKEIRSVPKTSCFCSQLQNERLHETKRIFFCSSKWKIAWDQKNFLLLEGKNALYGQVFCTVVTKRFGGFQKHLVFVLNVKIKDRMRPKEFSFARREDCLRSTSFLQACIKDVLGVTNTCSSGSQRWNLKKWKLHFNFCLRNKKFFPLFECWWRWEKFAVSTGKFCLDGRYISF